MTTLTEPTDRDLMLAVRGGDLDALDTLFGRHHRRLYGFLTRLTGDRDAAEDLVQDVFLRLLRFRQSYRDDGDFVPWLFSIARNVASTRYRVLRPTTVLDDQELGSSDEVGALDLLIAREDQQHLARTLASLPISHREVLLLRGVEELSHRQIAIALGCSEGAVRVRVHRALAALKREWLAVVGESS